MNRRIIYSRSDGGVNIVIPCRNIDESHLTDDQIIQRVWDMLPSDAINSKVITINELPDGRTFRNAWEHGGDKAQVNMDKARKIHLERIRDIRDQKLKALDVETIKALGKGDDVAITDIEAKKQVLRDLPQTFDLTVAKTPEALKEHWPKELK